MSALVGMFFLEMRHDHGDYRTGTVKAQLSPNDYLMVFDEKYGTHEVAQAAELTDVCEGCGVKLWSFFADKDKMLQSIKELQQEREQDGKAKVVHLRPPEKKDK